MIDIMIIIGIIAVMTITIIISMIAENIHSTKAINYHHGHHHHLVLLSRLLWSDSPAMATLGGKRRSGQNKMREQR